MKVGILLVAVAVSAAAVQESASDALGIHAAVLKAIFKGGIPTSFVVHAEYLAMQPPSERAWQGLGSVPTELRKIVAGIASGQAPPPASTHTADQFPAGAHILPKNEARALVRGGTAEPKGYPILQQEYGAADMLLLSKSAITADRLDVLVQYMHGCGSACGTYGYVWLHRTTLSGPWIARLVVTAGS